MSHNPPSHINGKNGKAVFEPPQDDYGLRIALEKGRSVSRGVSKKSVQSLVRATLLKLSQGDANFAIIADGLDRGRMIRVMDREQAKKLVGELRSQLPCSVFLDPGFHQVTVTDPRTGASAGGGGPTWD